jgi:hypothetical protein
MPKADMVADILLIEHLVEGGQDLGRRGDGWA